MTRKVAIDEEQVRSLLTEEFEDDLHVKRILSLSHATLGAVQTTSLSVAAIGKAMAWARGEDVTSKHAVKQVDRLLSNEDFDVWKLFGAWVPFVLAERNRPMDVVPEGLMTDEDRVRRAPRRGRCSGTGLKLERDVGRVGGAAPFPLVGQQLPDA